MSLPTPHIAHLTEEDYEHVYEPAEDSFILLDALEADADELRLTRPLICAEIGSGSGIASAFLSNLLGPDNSFIISVDINPHACSATRRTGEANHAPLNPVHCNLLDPLIRRIGQQVDVLLFNPPYVPTDHIELRTTQHARDIGGAWAGGDDGTMITNIVLDKLPDILSPQGRLYLVAVAQNKPAEIAKQVAERGFRCDEIIKRRAGRELLSVLRIQR